MAKPSFQMQFISEARTTNFHQLQSYNNCKIYCKYLEIMFFIVFLFSHLNSHWTPLSHSFWLSENNRKMWLSAKPKL